ncbi:HAD-IA family hydrolase [Ruegeria sp.]|uniref:HAD-IA family hydrolase n=1 Tax=Ruegeria sp. TaxID=1879320 RepID=UPI002309A7A5|nr:HAD-IA family hydrolase [Ruegeria sp.]MDA7963340.1 HAD-IA family hydrolase [Ruegeria sp.]
MATLDPKTIVAWDFDGVLNRNIVDGRFVWADRFEIDIGFSLDDFTTQIFRNGFDDVITGKVDLRDRIEDWAQQVGYTGGADTVLTYWFENDALPDTEVEAVMDILHGQNIRQIIVTNNEARGASYIENEMGYSARVEHLFASGRMGVRKPDPAFFRHVTDTLGVEPERMLLIDDCPKNVPAAIECGWRAFHFVDSTRKDLRGVLGIEPSKQLDQD